MRRVCALSRPRVTCIGPTLAFVPRSVCPVSSVSGMRRYHGARRAPLSKPKPRSTGAASRKSYPLSGKKMIMQHKARPKVYPLEACTSGQLPAAADPKDTPKTMNTGEAEEAAGYSIDYLKQSGQMSGRMRLFGQGHCHFLMGVQDAKYLPEDGTTHEVAFVGRSNVGKSSLINALTKEKRKPAITSKTPGRTQQLNFFAMGYSPAAVLGDKAKTRNLPKTPISDGLSNLRLTLVDLPGYGFAKGKTQAVEHWNLLLGDYATAPRTNLKRLIVLIDSRRGLLEIDREFLEAMSDEDVPLQIVLTKVDKTAPKDLDKVLFSTSAMAQTLPTCHPYIHVVSSTKEFGITELKMSILSTFDDFDPYL